MNIILLLFIAALAAGTPLISISDVKASNSSRAVSESQMDAFRLYSQYAGAAYCNSDTPSGKPVTCENHVCDSIKATVVASFRGLVSGIGGYVSVDTSRREIILSIRGTSNFRNFLNDLTFAPIPCDLVPGCMVHTGFATAWREIEDRAISALTDAVRSWPAYTIVATGHSLGGAAATIAAARLRRKGYPMDLYTYGSPRVGNAPFASFVSRQVGAEYRVTHVDDPVPRLPPIVLTYRHTSPEYWLSTGTAQTIDYRALDVTVCPGIANVSCNARSFGFDLPAHSYYLGPISNCGSSTFQLRRRADEDPDQELINRLNEWSRMDQEFVKQNPEENSS